MENVDLKRQVSENERHELIASLAEDLTVLEAEKFIALSEGVVFDGDLETYKRKLSYVKENYFGGAVGQRKPTNLEEETFEGETHQTMNIDPEVNLYVQAISRTAKR